MAIVPLLMVVETSSAPLASGARSVATATSVVASVVCETSTSRNSPSASVNA